MRIVPVIDIRNGVVVRAVAGERASYRPLVSPLARSPAPLDVVAGLVAHYEFRSLYIADLDAIEGRGSNDATMAALAATYPKLRIWLDAGLRGAEDIERSLALDHDIVIGSETFADVEAISALRAEPRIILSLDFRGGDFLGAPQLLAMAERWPSRVIVMTLARVGTQQGPDFGRLTEIVARAQRRDVYAAGGVRNAGDLARLEDIGAAGALVASALHDGALKNGPRASGSHATCDRGSQSVKVSSRRTDVSR